MKNKISFVNDNIFHSSMQTIVITVNCVGVMGKGIALYVKQHVPEAYEEYRELCNLGKMKIGKLAIFEKEVPILKTDDGYKKLLFFPTKMHWRNKSDLFEIRKGLEYFVGHYEDMGVKSIAFPALGCGNGGLSWNGVRPLMLEYLDNLDIPIEIYPPSQIVEKNKKSENLEKNQKITGF